MQQQKINKAKEAQENSVDKTVEKSVKKLVRNKIAYAGSVSLDGAPNIKAMLVAKREGDTVFYFASNLGSRRVAQWRKDSRACIYFNGGIVYEGVMLEGTMQILDDEASRRDIWTPSMGFVYKGGVDDPDYCVLKFTAKRGRYYKMFKSYDFEL